MAGSRARARTAVVRWIAAALPRVLRDTGEYKPHSCSKRSAVPSSLVKSSLTAVLTSYVHAHAFSSTRELPLQELQSAQAPCAGNATAHHRRARSARRRV
eukprot:3872230-Prymnesium_polylepis.2